MQTFQDLVQYLEKNMDSFMCCCASCKPRYKRLVDAIYPRNLTDGVVSSKLTQLTFYSISHPEKLNRIGIYLVNHLSRDLYRQRFSLVEVSVEAMDSLLKACHGSPSLQQFIESYLKMVQKLLETNDPHLEKLATDLFVRFSTIEEDTPSYHRQYDFFISKFSSMCHASRGDQTKIQRFNGLRGLRGVIWKSVADDLQASIWEKQHMDKIVPSILFNLRDDRENKEDSDVMSVNLYNNYIDENALNDDPSSLALQCLRELMGKASFGSLKSVLEPVMKHCDAHKKWDPPPTFAINTFRAIIFSIQTQNAHFVIQELINHLEEMANAGALIRIGIATVLSSIVSIASSSIGPLVLGIFNSLLKRLRVSVEFQQSKQCPSVTEEKTFQETLITAMGDFANSLPDYQKIDIMLFTATSIPIISHEERQFKTSDEFLQKVLVKTLLKVATKYKSFYFANVFTDTFFRSLLQICLAPNSEVRLNAQQIFHTLFDRHDNLKQLTHLLYVHDVADLQLSVEKCSRQDQMFMHRHIHNVTSIFFRVVCFAEDEHLKKHLDAVLCSMCLLCIEVGNDETLIELFRLAFGMQALALDTEIFCFAEDEHLKKHLDSVLCSMCLLCIEVGNDETLIELFRLAFGMQALALDTEICDFSIKKRAEIHNMVAKYLNLSVQLLAIPALCQHVQQVIKLRAQRGHARLNIIAAAIANADPLKVTNHASSSSPVKAPIAHMESEDDFTSRALGLENDPALLFDLEDVSEALKASNKDVSKLFIPFKPVQIPGLPITSVDKAIGLDDVGIEKVAAHQSNIRDIASTVTFTAAEDEADVRRERPDTLGDTMSFDSSSIEWTPPGSTVASRRNTIFGAQMGQLQMPTNIETLRAEVNQPIDLAEEERKDQAKSREILQMFRERPLEELSSILVKDLEATDLNKTVEQLSAEDEADVRRERPDTLGDTMSFDSSSIEWTPPGSTVASRRNTIFGAQMGQMQMPTNIETLRAEVNQPIDLAEEERKDQAKSREILQMFRERPLEELSSILVKDLEATDLNKTVEQLCKRNNEWAKLQEYGSNGKQKNIFEINFPSIVR
uniref:EFR3-like protein n=1 Tax=Panagrolaimus sp. JU765 TaxID=591449 RepID=A0AC34QGC3_9BILA